MRILPGEAEGHHGLDQVAHPGGIRVPGIEQVAEEAVLKRPFPRLPAPQPGEAPPRFPVISFQIGVDARGVRAQAPHRAWGQPLRHPPCGLREPQPAQEKVSSGSALAEEPCQRPLRGPPQDLELHHALLGHQETLCGQSVVQGGRSQVGHPPAVECHPHPPLQAGQLQLPAVLRPASRRQVEQRHHAARKGRQGA